ncbi:hypothetical protein PR048_006712 [Dryococelus australis]|uniref:Uncharacterized protein n=1 Tax=Dryococelus australis TaxID=614101 RepID=A0ABQ9IBQ0_9NEOP|nr:hypothetical protein PR048_006712 [Dryococelus australis]
MTQLLNLREHKLDAVASFIGYDIRVHRQYYRLQEDTMELAKVSKLLIDMGKCHLSSMKGKNLDEVMVNSDECLTDEGGASEDDMDVMTSLGRQRTSCLGIPRLASFAYPAEGNTTNQHISVWGRSLPLSIEECQVLHLKFSICGSVHLTPEMKAAVQNMNTDLVLQVLDMIFKSFKDHLRQQYSDWLLAGNNALTPVQKMKNLLFCNWQIKLMQHGGE